MKRDLNKEAFPEGKGNGLSRAKILRGRSNFKRLFEDPEKIFYADHISLRFYTKTDNVSDCKMGFVVARRLGNAVKRNYVKRILREAYRLNQHKLSVAVSAAGVKFGGAFTASTVRLNFDTVQKEVSNLIGQAAKYLYSTSKL